MHSISTPAICEPTDTKKLYTIEHGGLKMDKYKVAAVVSALVFFFGCSSITIYHDYYNTDDLGSYTTFDWLSRRFAVVIAGADDVPDKGGLVEKALKESVNEQLFERGLTQSTDNPDLLISYSVDAKVWASKDVPKKAAEESGPMAQQDSKGSFFLDFKDARSRETLWRAAAYDIEVKNMTPEKIEDIIEKTVAKIFKKFPKEPVD